MLEIKKSCFPTYQNWDMVIYGVRASFKSYDKMDSHMDFIGGEYVLGENDAKLLKALSKAGNGEDKFLRQLPVIVQIKAPRYFWEQMATYKVGTTFTSESTMHTITDRAIGIDDFATDEVDPEALELLKGFISGLNKLREMYVWSKDMHYWHDIIKLLPQSYLQERTVSLNYAVLKNIYKQRAGHKLSEWAEFRSWVDNKVPYADLLIAV